MKKIRFICIFLLIATLLFSFAACNNDDEESSYDFLNGLIANVSYPFTITTKVTTDGDILNGNYTVTEEEGVVSASYSYEKLSAFELVNGELVAPDSYKTTVNGSVKIKDGKIIEQNGASVNLSAESFIITGISLSEDNLTDVQMGDSSFSARISSLQSVTGLNISANDASISITYNETKITKMVLAYSTSAYQTEIAYSFN